METQQLQEARGVEREAGPEWQVGWEMEALRQGRVTTELLGQRCVQMGLRPQGQVKAEAQGKCIIAETLGRAQMRPQEQGGGETERLGQARAETVEGRQRHMGREQQGLCRVETTGRQSQLQVREVERRRQGHVITWPGVETNRRQQHGAETGRRWLWCGERAQRGQRRVETEPRWQGGLEWDRQTAGRGARAMRLQAEEGPRAASGRSRMGGSRATALLIPRGRSGVRRRDYKSGQGEEGHVCSFLQPPRQARHFRRRLRRLRCRRRRRLKLKPMCLRP
jgi:hypothetical protein